jgi:hypothetical protein
MAGVIIKEKKSSRKNLNYNLEEFIFINKINQKKLRVLPKKGMLIDDIKRNCIFSDVESDVYDTKFMIEQSAYEKFKQLRDRDIDDFMIRGLKAFFKKEEKKPSYY